MQKGVVVVPMGASGALEDIPKSPGVYAYYLSFISRRSLGLFQGASFTDSEIKSAKSILERKFLKFLTLRKERRYQGKVRDTSRYSHLSPSYEVELEETFSDAPLQSLLAMNNEFFLSAIDMIEGTLLLQPPVYVGISVDQTLRDRCLQHRKDFENSVDGAGFGARLKRMGFEWTDLVYVARASQVYGAELKEVEKSMQLLINPILSLR